MATLTTTTRRVLAVASLALVAGLAAPTGASAAPLKIYPCWKFGTCGGFKPKPTYFKPHYGYGGGWGYGAAAMGGLALGAIAASAVSANPAGECFIERRRVEDEEGNVYIRRVRVCE